jgi:hypothetical protein
VKPSRLPALLLVLAFPARCLALFGVGDVVYDPANVAQTINLLHQAQQEFDRLGSLLGVSTQQFDQLVQLAVAIGNTRESAPYLSSPSPAQIQALVQANPGQQNASLGALYNSNNQLDAFMGVTLEQWTQAIGNPQAFYRSVLINPAIARIGASAGLASPAISYLQWYAARSPEDQYNFAPRAAADVSNLLNGDWLQNGQQRRLNLQGLAAANQDAQAKASAAQTLTDQAHVQAQFQANANAILLESAVQAGEAHEAVLRSVSSQNQAMQEEAQARRNADAIRLDLPP